MTFRSAQKPRRPVAAHVRAVLLGVLVAAAGAASASAETAYQVSTIAGVMPGSVDGPAALARFNIPTGIAVDANGAIYIADTTLRRISSGGTVSTILGTPRQIGGVVGAGALALDADGNFCIGQWPGVCKISPAGATLLQFPASAGFVPGVATAADGTIYYVDLLGNRIAKITPDGQPSAFAGSPGGTAGSADGTGTAAQFNTPWGVAVGPDGTVYVTDGGNYTIRRITPAGEVTTLAGTVGDHDAVDGTGAAAHFGFPQAIAIDADGNLYVGDSGGLTVRKVTPSGTVTTLAGDANEQGNVDGAGAEARFSGILGIAATPDGILYVTDNGTIRRVAEDGMVTTIAGIAVSGSTDGALDVARFSQPSGITIAPTGDIFVTGGGNSLRRISDGMVSSLASSDVIAGDSGRPSSVVIAADGTIYAADSYDHTISKRPPNGSPTLLAGTFGMRGSDDGVGAAASFTGPYGLALDSDGNLIVADWLRVRKVTSDGIVTTLAGGASTDGQPALDGLGTDAMFYGAYDIAIDASDNIWVADSTNGAAAVRMVTPGGLVSTLAGGLNYSGYAADGTGESARFSGIQGIAVAPGGDLYVVESTDSTIRRVTTAGVVTTIAGRHRTMGAVDGRGDDALFNRPQDLCVAADGTIYVADPSNFAIRAITSGAAPEFDTQPLPASVSAGANVTLVTRADVSDSSYRWEVDGNVIANENGPALALTNIQPANAGLYVAMAANGLIETASNGAIVGVSTSSKVIGTGTELQPTDVHHPNGNIFDQVLLTGVGETITADAGQITRTSFIDLDGNIVQVEFSGAGSLSLVLAASSGPAQPVNYNQAVNYMSGHAGIVIVGANETTNVSVFTVGRATAFDPTGHFDITKPISATNDPATNGSPLFDGKEPSVFAGFAKIAFIAIASTDGKFGGLRAANAKFQGWGGLTGVYAPGVEFVGPVYVSDITAYDEATPVIITGSVSDARVTGGDLFQDNARAVRVHGFAKLKFVAGGDSAGRVHPAQTNQAVLKDDGVDVTSQLVEYP